VVSIQFKHIVLAGNPNSGKTTLFNALTGLNQKTSNIAGTTVDIKSGKLKVEGENIKIVDAPGLYSLSSQAIDEKIAQNAIGGTENNPVDLIVYVADASNLRRHLFLFSEISQIGKPMILVLNMVDRAEKKGITIDIERLQNELGIRVISINARKNIGIKSLVEEFGKDQFIGHHSLFVSPSDANAKPYDKIDGLLDKVQKSTDLDRRYSRNLDSILTHRFWAFPIFIGILFILFQSVFKLAEAPMNWVELGFDSLINFCNRIISDGWGKDLLINGILAGLSGIIVFIPQIVILFFLLTVLEETGYMARVSFILDRIMRLFGLSGKSVIPIMSGAACAIPAIMATRNIENYRSRIITIMVTPLMSCSARLPVYTLLISMLVPQKTYFGIFGSQGLALMAMYILGILMTLVAAWVFKLILRDKNINTFLIELPDYRPPKWKSVFIVCWTKSKSFVTEAGKIILIVSILLWFLSSYSWFNGGLVNASNLEESFAGTIGKLIEPLIKPLGFNWKIGIALITSFAAREIFVGTISTLYSTGTDGTLTSIRDAMLSDVNMDGTMVFDSPTLISLLLFYAFAMQCMSTLAVVYKETNQWKWPLIQLIYMSGLAYLISLLTYQLSQFNF